MSELKVSTNCPFCNGFNTVSELKAPNENESFVLHSVPTDGNIQLPEAGAFVNVMVCSNCKQLQFFAPNYAG